MTLYITEKKNPQVVREIPNVRRVEKIFTSVIVFLKGTNYQYFTFEDVTSIEVK